MRQKLVLDAAPLILAAKTRLHTLMNQLENDYLTTTIVEKEVLAGNYPEKPALEKLLKEDIQVKRVNEYIRQRGLHPGEASAIILAKETGAVLVTDDKVATTVAKALNVPTVSTTYLIFRALNQNKIGARDAEDLLKELIENNWYCDTQTLARIYSRLRQTNR
jgi:predicted nucleic acid-binding protein